MNQFYIGLGSNLGNRRLNLLEAFHHLEKMEHSQNFRMSKIYESDPVDGSDQPSFLNAVVEAETNLSPFELLDYCQKIENQMGRERHDMQRWTPREIDIDILFYADRIIQSNRLTIPHSEIPFRSFVLEPMCELNPYFIHPDKHVTIWQMHKNLIHHLNIREYSVEDERHV